MIAQLSGSVIGLGATWAVIDVGGVGMKTLCGPNTTAELRHGQQATLATSLVVREDSLTLYGFGTAEERDFFELLMTASGVGPKLAQAALAVLTPDDLRSAIVTENLVALTKVPGVGRKGAQRIVIELKDKVNALAPSADAATGVTPVRTKDEEWREQVSQGLQGLGWSAKDAEAACGRVEHLAEDNSEISIAELMRAALRTLAK
ncbi:MAG TPA: Holliday junction branch migration protein RuvA [Microlunatus sp.]